jgi:hypothetical protein
MDNGGGLSALWGGMETFENSTLYLDSILSLPTLVPGRLLEDEHQRRRPAKGR